VVVSKIWSALPPLTAAGAAFAVRTTLPPDTAAGALEERVNRGRAAAGRMVETGTLGSTAGLLAGAPLSEEWAASGSLHAAGVLRGEVEGHGVRPSGVDAVPGATSAAPWLVRQEAPMPEAGQG
jgi:hypothetical protein